MPYLSAARKTFFENDWKWPLTKKFCFISYNGGFISEFHFMICLPDLHLGCVERKDPSRQLRKSAKKIIMICYTENI